MTGQRKKHDLYQTPFPFAHQIARQLHRNSYLRDRMTVLEPAAGDGRLIRQLHYFASGLKVDAVEIQAGFKRHIEASRVVHAHMEDFLEWKPPRGRKYDLILTNPPFSLARDYIEKCTRLLSSTGYLVMFLRLSALAGQKRQSYLWAAYDYVRLYVCSARPSFIGDNEQTDKADYAWFVFPPSSGKVTYEIRRHENHAYERERRVTVVHLPPPDPRAVDVDLSGRFSECQRPRGRPHIPSYRKDA